MLVATACEPSGPVDNLDNTADDPALNLAVVPRPQTPLDRAGLFAAVARAASAEASSQDHAETQRTLDGRQFELRIRFGCRGPSDELRADWLGWVRDSESGTLRIRAKPTLGPDDPLVREIGGGGFEAVEGFWIPRPWLLDASCPAGAAIVPAGSAQDEKSEPDASSSGAIVPSRPSDEEKAADPVPNWPRIGIAHFFTESDARIGRRARRAYEAVKTVDPKQPLGSQGFNLVLSGRLQALPDGRVIACVAKSPDNAPECVVSAQFDRVRIERPENGEVIAEWGGG